MTKLVFTEQAESLFWKRRINNTWVLIPMFENNEDWKKNIGSLTIELYGIRDIVLGNPELESRLMLAIVKLNGLKENDDFSLHRKTVFEVISLIEELRDFGKE